MTRFLISARARKDIVGIGEYTDQEWGVVKRNEYLTQMEAKFSAIARMPLSGTACEWVRAGYRKSLYESHIIFYRQVDDDTIEIIRVLHASMDVSRQFGEGGS